MLYLFPQKSFLTTNLSLMRLEPAVFDISTPATDAYGAPSNVWRVTPGVRKPGSLSAAIHRRRMSEDSDDDNNSRA